MKPRILLTLLVLFGTIGFTQAQVAVRNVNEPSKTLILGQEMTSRTVQARFGRPQFMESHYDDAAGGYMDVYEYAGLVFSCVDSKIYDFNLSSRDYVVWIDNKYSVKIGDNITTFQRSIPASDVIIRADGLFTSFYFRVLPTPTFSDDALIIKADLNKTVMIIQWYCPD